MYDLQLSPLFHSKAVQNKVEGILVSIFGQRAIERWTCRGMRMMKIGVTERPMWDRQYSLPRQKVTGFATHCQFDLEHLTSSVCDPLCRCSVGIISKQIPATPPLNEVAHESTPCAQ